MTNPMRNGQPPTGGALASLVVLAVASLAAVVTLVILGRPVDSVLSIITIVMVPTSLGILNASKLNKLADTVERVESNVNGRMSQLIDSKTTTKEGEHRAD